MCPLTPEHDTKQEVVWEEPINAGMMAVNWLIRILTACRLLLGEITG